MNQNNDEIKPEQPAPETPEATQMPAQPEPVGIPVKEAEKAPPSRLKQFFNKALIWLIVIVIAFLAGFLTDHFLRYTPLSEAMVETQSELDQANKEISGLPALKTEIRDANKEITSLQDELAVATAHLGYFQVLVDVNNARIELFLDNIEGAQASLVDTQQRLEDLLPFIAEVDAELALSLPRRLDLILSGLERDPETGTIDLELFTKDLLEIEPLLFGN